MAFEISNDSVIDGLGIYLFLQHNYGIGKGHLEID